MIGQVIKEAIKPDFIIEGEMLARHSTLGVGGPADYFAEIPLYNADCKQIVEAYEFARDNKLDIFILGKGSNVLFSDRGFRGLVIKLVGGDISFSKGWLWVDSGVMVSELVTMAHTTGLSGFEKFAGLPGTIGGAIYGNAGCYGAEFWDVVEEVMFFDGEYIQVLKKSVADYGYRWSFFKENPGWIIIAARLNFAIEGKDKVKSETRMWREARRNSQPRGRSVGCFFKNPTKDGSRVSAGKLLDAVSLKGKKVGNAMVSPVHANFFVNCGGATARDFLGLINIAKGRVLDEFGVLLEEEIIKVGEF
ncbi:MAG: UDP-N-acetylmuramate dehydrogenase [Candidatus Yanofskybacteria bacterium]|nr:UDP-N-acetylmuramate dehydrogenase [Candidatus Yanofskybacteria bacterium]